MTETYSETCQTSKMECFAKIVNGHLAISQNFPYLMPQKQLSRDVLNKKVFWKYAANLQENAYGMDVLL